MTQWVRSGARARPIKLPSACARRLRRWTDVVLSEQGLGEAAEAGRLLKGAGLTFDVCFTSVLSRAVQTANLALQEMGLLWIPMEKSWRLNERHYGSLQGLNKKQTADLHGEAQVHIWRRSYAVPPPPLADGDERLPSRDPRYAGVPEGELPRSEALEQTVSRVLPFWESTVAPAIRSGRKVLVAAHGNSLRALVKYLDDISEEVIPELNIPTGVPLIYKLDKDLKPIKQDGAAAPLSGVYLGDPEEVAARAKAVAAQAAGKKE